MFDIVMILIGGRTGGPKCSVVSVPHILIENLNTTQNNNEEKTKQFCQVNRH
jgi:hypothetical protein